MNFTVDLSWQHCAKVFFRVRLVRLHQVSALPILQRVWMRKILQQDEEVFFDSHLDMTDASVWIRPALRSIKRKRSIIHEYFSYQRLSTLFSSLSFLPNKME